MDGGFENQSELSNNWFNSSQQDYWTTQVAEAGIFSTGGRSGPKYVQYTQSGGTHKGFKVNGDLPRSNMLFNSIFKGFGRALGGDIGVCVIK